MFLQRVIERNPDLIDTAVKLHQEGKIPANTWLFDLDAVAENARIQSKVADELGLTVYVMAKQHSRNPFVTMVALKQGLHKTVAVDMHGAKMNYRYRVPIGHIGHLNQIPKHEIGLALDMQPEVITVYSENAAENISEAALQKGITQDLLLRVYGPDDFFYPGEEGGFSEEEVLAAAQEIQKLPNVDVAGVVTMPALTYPFKDTDEPVHTTENLKTITRVAKLLENRLGIEIKQVNTPGNNSVEYFPMLKQAGATHVEPGHGLLGTTPTHIGKGTLPERPGYCYVTEVSHHYNGYAYAFGGGLWGLITEVMDPVSTSAHALVGSDPESAKMNMVDYAHKAQIIDYHVPLVQGDRCRVGDTVVMCMYTQAQVTRSYNVAVSGVSEGEPVCWGLFDQAATMLDDSFNVVSPKLVMKSIDELLERY